MGNNDTKEQIANRICTRLGTRTPGFSIGSTEPKILFILICERLGLTCDKNSTKPELAKFITESAGIQWLPNFESRGGTVTRDGLRAVEEAVNFFIG